MFIFFTIIVLSYLSEKTLFIIILFIFNTVINMMYVKLTFTKLKLCYGGYHRCV